MTESELYSDFKAVKLNEIRLGEHDSMIECRRDSNRSSMS